MSDDAELEHLRDNLSAGSRLSGVSGLWVRTDEGDDVVVLMRGHRRIGRPRSFVRYGERLGQGLLGTLPGDLHLGRDGPKAVPRRDRLEFLERHLGQPIS